MQDKSSSDQESQKAAKKSKVLCRVDINKPVITAGAKYPVKGNCNRHWRNNWNDQNKSTWIKGALNIYK